MPIKCGANQTETKPYQSNALDPNELRVRQGKKRNTARIDVAFQGLIISYARKEDILVSQDEYGCWSSVGRLQDYVGI